MDERRLFRIQALSGLAFGTFLVLHLANAMTAAAGPAAYDGLQRGLRWYYQFPLIELLCVGLAAIVHMACGVARWRRRRGSDASTPPSWLRWHRRSGWFLLLVFFAHVGATRGVGLLLDEPVDLSYLNFSLVHWAALMVPYYVLLFCAGAWHGIHGACVALRVLGVNPPLGLGTHRPAALRNLFLVVATLGVLGVAGMWGLTTDVDESRFGEFAEFYEPFTPDWIETWR